MPVAAEISSPLISVWVNGRQQELPPGQSVADLLAFLDLPAERLAVELNKSLVRKRDWQKTPVTAGSQIEIVEFVGGG